MGLLRKTGGAVGISTTGITDHPQSTRSSREPPQCVLTRRSPDPAPQAHWYQQRRDGNMGTPKGRLIHQTGQGWDGGGITPAQAGSPWRQSSEGRSPPEPPAARPGAASGTAPAHCAAARPGGGRGRPLPSHLARWDRQISRERCLSRPAPQPPSWRSRSHVTACSRSPPPSPPPPTGNRAQIAGLESDHRLEARTARGDVGF